MHVAEIIHSKYPDKTIIICADNDQWLQDGKNPGLEKAIEAAKRITAKLVMPDFSMVDEKSISLHKPTDFNDLYKLTSSDEVKRQLSKFTNTIIPSETENEPKVSYRRASDVEMKPIDWLWPSRIARGKVSMIAGNPGLGKSQITAYMAGIVTNGGNWPDNAPCKKGNVIFLSAEDDAADTIVPRLKAANANLDQVFILEAVHKGFDERHNPIPHHFNLATDLVELEGLINKIKNIALIIIDPISAYLGKIDSHNTADVRAVLAPLAKLAEKYNAAIICVSHLNKSGTQEALLRVAGSTGFVAASRAAYGVIKDKTDPDKRLFLPLKNNLGNDKTGLAFNIQQTILENGIETSYISWLPEVVTITADEAMNGVKGENLNNALQDAKEFLIEILSEGAQPVTEIMEQATQAGYSKRTIERAKKSLKIKPKKGRNDDKQWWWSLPDKENQHFQESQDCQTFMNTKFESEINEPPKFKEDINDGVLE